MSRGPGKIEREIEALFRPHPHEAFTSDDLALRIFGRPDAWQGGHAAVARQRKAQRVSILRAAKNVCRRTGWVPISSWGRGHMQIYANPRNMTSWGLAQALSRSMYFDR